MPMMSPGKKPPFLMAEPDSETAYAVPTSWLSNHPPTVLRFRPDGCSEEEHKSAVVLEYFAYRALAEHLKLLLEVTATPYDLVCHWSPHFMGAIRYRDYVPHGQLPVLTDPALGFQLAESGAIFRHVARKTGVGGRTPAEVARVDMLCMLAEDVRTMTDWKGEDRYLKAAERAVEHGTRRGEAIYLVGDALSAADVWMFWVLHDVVLNQLGPYPGLRRFHDAFLALPAVAAFYGSARAFPFCKYQKDPERVPGTYEPQNYTYDAPYHPSVYAEHWVPDASHPAAASGASSRTYNAIQHLSKLVGRGAGKS